MNAVPGGHFPVPSAIAHLLSKLPPSACFQVYYSYSNIHNKAFMCAGGMPNTQTLMQQIAMSILTDDSQGKIGGQDVMVC